MRCPVCGWEFNLERGHQCSRCVIRGKDLSAEMRECGHESGNKSETPCTAVWGHEWGDHWYGYKTAAAMFDAIYRDLSRAATGFRRVFR